MFGVTTACVQQVPLLEPDYDCLVFHATGTGGQSMEKLLDSHLLSGVLDLTTTEVCDFLFGGVLACTDDRFGAVRARALCGPAALDMVNFGGMETVPERYQGRLFYPHNPQVTLMRTTPAENARQGEWIASRLNRCDGPVRFLIPEGGVSALDAPGQALGSGGRRRVVHRAGNAPGADRRPPPGARALPHQRPAVRPHGGRAVPEISQH